MLGSQTQRQIGCKIDDGGYGPPSTGFSKSLVFIGEDNGPVYLSINVDKATQAFLVKQGGFRPDYFSLETDAMVIFPWDRHVVDEAGAIEVNPLYRGII